MVPIEGGVMVIIGMGTQVLECARVRGLIEQHAETFLQQVFDEQEIVFCNGQKHTTEYFTALWAVKEAAFRALGLTDARVHRWKDLVVLGSGIASLRLQVQGGTREQVDRRGIQQFLVAAAYCRTFATATVLALASDFSPVSLRDTAAEL
ncbi:MAG: 4'-phosphopantetheinyl transferase superfamily protein [Thermogemmata sp.]|nr:4'-phosphopantetheinyl transferase superfamily protein [Thermogemmata sp.]